MKKGLYILLLIMSVQAVQAVTYFKSWVNGNEVTTITQGELYAWEYDISAPGGVAHMSIFIDVNRNQLLDSTDVLMVEFDQQDGEVGMDGPGDSSAVQDGLIYSMMGPFGVAPGDYIYFVQDQNDGSSITASLHVLPLPNVTIMVQGTIVKDGVVAPDPDLANIVIEAEPENENSDMSFWMGLTDENGEYTINLPDSALNEPWKIYPGFTNQFSPYIPDPESYHDQWVQTGNNSSVNFSFHLPGTWVYGHVIDENQEIVPVSDGGSLENQNSGAMVDFNISDGFFITGAVFGNEDTTDVPFNLSIWGDALIPDYMVPNTWDQANTNYNFTLSIGDSVEKNFYVHHTNAVIYVRVLKDGGTPSEEEHFKINANNHDLGFTWDVTDQTGLARLHVVSAYMYDIWFNSDDESYPLPEGYFIEEGSNTQASPGDTVTYHLIQASNYIAGEIHIKAGDESHFDPDQAQIQANGANGSHYSTKINMDSSKYKLFLGNGDYTVNFNDFNGNFLSKPAQYEHVHIEDAPVDSLDFELSFAHAELVVKLKGAPGMPDEWMGIQTEGMYPDVFQTNAQVELADTAYHFVVCDGNWQIYAPWFNGYTSSFTDTVVEVNDNEVFYYVEIQYKAETGLEDNTSVPNQFYVNQNYPNPFGEKSKFNSPVTTIEFGLTQKTPVQVYIYDVTGRRILNLENRVLGAGTHCLQWNASRFASGIYFYQVVTPHKTITKRLLLLK